MIPDKSIKKNTLRSVLYIRIKPISVRHQGCIGKNPNPTSIYFHPQLLKVKACLFVYFFEQESIFIYYFIFI